MHTGFKVIIWLAFLNLPLSLMAGYSTNKTTQIEYLNEMNPSMLDSIEATTVGAFAGCAGGIVGGLSAMGTGVNIPLGTISIGYTFISAIIAALLSNVERKN